MVGLNPNSIPTANHYYRASPTTSEGKMEGDSSVVGYSTCGTGRCPPERACREGQPAVQGGGHRHYLFYLLCYDEKFSLSV